MLWMPIETIVVALAAGVVYAGITLKLVVLPVIIALILETAAALFEEVGLLGDDPLVERMEVHLARDLASA